MRAAAYFTELSLFNSCRSLANQPKQPTKFWLDVHQITEVFETPLLVSSLAAYSERRQDLGLEDAEYTEADSSTPSKSVLFLQIHSAADFFSSNRTLMEFPPAVDVDISA